MLVYPLALAIYSTVSRDVIDATVTSYRLALSVVLLSSRGSSVGYIIFTLKYMVSLFWVFSHCMISIDAKEIHVIIDFFRQLEINGVIVVFFLQTITENMLL